MDNRLNEIFRFLALMDTPGKADVIIGFGHFDMNIPRQCCELYLKGYGKKIIYTGGVGAGSADLKYAEAVEFFNFTRKYFPQIPLEDIIIEDKSTNSGENIRFTIEKMKALFPLFNFGIGICSAILVATPARQLRVYLTVRMYLENTELINLPPETTFNENLAVFSEKGESLTKQLTGEMDRLLEYPAKGLCEKVVIPGNIIIAYNQVMAGA
jgi:uncharacterized SAM-binding protein YcdF (DUF218 family)